jgi:protein ImuB
VQGLRRAGLKTIGDTAARPRHEITVRFGAAFAALLEQALGQGDSPISPRRPVPDYVVEKRFAEPVATAAIIMPTLISLARHLVGAMEPHGKGARQLMASFFRTDGLMRSIAVETGHPVTTVETVARLFTEKLDTLADPLDPGFGYDLIRLAATRTVDVTPTQSGFDTHEGDADAVAVLSDRLAARLGVRQIIRYLPADTHIPEQADLAVPALQMPPGLSPERWPSHLADEPPRRPLRLFARPEEIEVLFAEIPDKPPQRFNWRRVTHLVLRAEGPERIAMEWWHLHPTGPTRDYFRVENQDGLRFWLFRDGMYGELADADGKPVNPRWFMHGLFA